MLSPYSTNVVKYKIYDKRTQKTYEKARFNTYTLSCFNEYRENFYRGKRYEVWSTPVDRKVVPANIKSLLHSNLALAVWYLDDGALRTDSKAFRLYTNSYNLSEVELLKDTLLMNFNVQSTIRSTSVDHTLYHKQSNGSILHIGATGSQAENFCNIIKPIVASTIPSMLYKFF